MTTHHIASWLSKQSDVPLTVLKPVATKIGVSTNHLGAALFAGQLVYENQETIVKYADRGGVHAGQFLHNKSSERYGDDHPLTEYLGENVEALDEAFEGSEEEATTFAEFYRRLRAVDRDTPDLADQSGFLTGIRGTMTDARGAVTDAKGAVTDVRGAVAKAKGTVAETKDAVPTPTLGSDADATEESEAVEIPVRDGGRRSGVGEDDRTPTN
ncbi:hypothetical protein [Halorussus salinisoli]|uniref:hypothetical protein n=1 Tax=Halorussus salinisoli TaxID=2558242 RepID=UPI0010C17DCD|nr:hypothetical protein [Halorussus salinisoli]